MTEECVQIFLFKFSLLVFPDPIHTCTQVTLLKWLLGQMVIPPRVELKVVLKILRNYEITQILSDNEGNRQFNTHTRNLCYVKDLLSASQCVEVKHFY